MSLQFVYCFCKFGLPVAYEPVMRSAVYRHVCRFKLGTRGPVIIYIEGGVGLGGRK